MVALKEQKILLDIMDTSRMVLSHLDLDKVLSIILS